FEWTYNYYERDELYGSCFEDEDQNGESKSSGSESESGILDDKATKSRSIEEWGGVVVETLLVITLTKIMMISSISGNTSIMGGHDMAETLTHGPPPAQAAPKAYTQENVAVL
nr:hypothetical protein [Tanacetum cinerariifolium]